MSTPFIDSLSASDKEIVARKSLGLKRPSYFNAAIAREITLSQAQRSDAEAPSPYQQISQDFEALLILLGQRELSGLISFIRTALESGEPEEEVELMVNMHAKQLGVYGQANVDTYRPALNFEQVRGRVARQVEAKRVLVPKDAGDSTGTISPDSNIDTLLPDMSSLFSATSAEYSQMLKPESLQAHNLIMSAQTLNFYSIDAQARKQELSSWLTILQAYLV